MSKQIIFRIFALNLGNNVFLNIWYKELKHWLYFCIFLFDGEKNLFWLLIDMGILITCLIPKLMIKLLKQICFWIYMWLNDNVAVEFVGKIFISGTKTLAHYQTISFSFLIHALLTITVIFLLVVSFLAAVGFAVYGGK